MQRLICLVFLFYYHFGLSKVSFASFMCRKYADTDIQIQSNVVNLARKPWKSFFQIDEFLFFIILLLLDCEFYFCL
jgi:hypothetical protein